ncbi:MAG: radical SAM protein [Deltaproteobacteria bacterium]|nr:radical SAM protein [Deltaproteobacteria bacterium]
MGLRVTTLRDTIRQRLARERGTLYRSAPSRVALVYPSPYRVGMSSLGYQVLYRELNRHPDTSAERAFAPEDLHEARERREAVLTYETGTPLGAFPVVALSVAYETELAGLISTLELAQVPSLREERDPRSHPFVLVGGPLTFSNPLPVEPYADAVVLGEAEEVIHRVLDTLSEHREHAARLRALAQLPHVWVPLLHGESLPAIAAADNALLPAYGQVMTPDTELSDMFLVETERGCSRGCTYCVMRRSTNGGMRLASLDAILARIPEDARKVGLVGAAVSDHPKIVDLVDTLAGQGRSVGLSSLRPDRLTDRFVGALKRAGYKTLTTAMDGPSERLRASLERHAKVRHLEKAAELARAHGMQTLKLYLMVGLPTETDDDIDECVTFITGLSKVVPVALGVAPFVAKKNTPLDGQPFAGIATVEARLERLRRGLQGRADVRPTSARWAWVEWVLAQHGARAGRAVHDAVRAGGRFADWRRAFEAAGVAGAPRRRLATVPSAG